LEIGSTVKQITGGGEKRFRGEGTEKLSRIRGSPGISLKVKSSEARKGTGQEGNREEKVFRKVIGGQKEIYKDSRLYASTDI